MKLSPCPLKVLILISAFILPSSAFCKSPSLRPSPVGEVRPSALPSPSKPSEVQIGFDHLEENTIFFNAPAGFPTPKPLKTGLFELNYLGSLKSDEGGMPYFIFTGKPCENCLDDRIIYVIRPSGGKPLAFVYPGKIFDPRSRALLVESRTFFGKCLPNKGDVLVIFQKEKVDRRKFLQSSVLIAEAAKDYFDETLLERHLPHINHTLKLVKRKSCREIEGRNRLMLSKPLDLHPHDNGDNEENDDETPSTGDSPEEARPAAVAPSVLPSAPQNL